MASLGSSFFRVSSLLFSPFINKLTRMLIFMPFYAVAKMRGRHLANDDPDTEEPASCKWSSGGAGLLQMMIQRDRPPANDDPEGSCSKKRNWGFQ